MRTAEREIRGVTTVSCYVLADGSLVSSSAPVIVTRNGVGNFTVRVPGLRTVVNAVAAAWSGACFAIAQPVQPNTALVYTYNGGVGGSPSVDSAFSLTITGR